MIPFRLTLKKKKKKVFMSKYVSVLRQSPSRNKTLLISPSPTPYPSLTKDVTVYLLNILYYRVGRRTTNDHSVVTKVGVGVTTLVSTLCEKDHSRGGAGRQTLYLQDEWTTLGKSMDSTSSFSVSC